MLKIIMKPDISSRIQNRASGLPLIVSRRDNSIDSIKIYVVCIEAFKIRVANLIWLV